MAGKCTLQIFYKSRTLPVFRCVESLSPKLHLETVSCSLYSNTRTNIIPAIYSGWQTTSRFNLLGPFFNYQNHSVKFKSVTAENVDPTVSIDEEETKKKREQQWKKMKLSFIVFGTSLCGMGVLLFVTWGRPPRDENGNIIEDEFIHMGLLKQYTLRLWKELKSFNKMIIEPSREKLLPDPLTEPYYQPPYTLVVEMTGVLVHPEWTYQTGWRFKKRPGVDFFLQQVGLPTFELVVYTSEQGFTAYPILEKLDPDHKIMYKLFRDATLYKDGAHIKDLNCLNRDLSKVLFVDWNDSAINYNPRNALKVKKWDGNDQDRTLFDLAIMLKTLSSTGMNDVRDVLDFYRQFDDPIEAFKENQRRAVEQEEEAQRLLQEQQAKGSLVNGWTSSFLRRKL